MRNFLRTHQIELVIDLSPPYAVEVTRNARRVCQDAGVRYVRPSSRINAAVYVSSLEECLTFLQNVTDCVLFTTGSKNMPDFEQVRGSNRFLYRVLPIRELTPFFCDMIYLAEEYVCHEKFKVFLIVPQKRHVHPGIGVKKS